jgi:hypothetical protein
MSFLLLSYIIDSGETPGLLPSLFIFFNMVLNGLGHNIAYILAGQCFGAFAGNFTRSALF